MAILFLFSFLFINDEVFEIQDYIYYLLDVVYTYL